MERLGIHGMNTTPADEKTKERKARENERLLKHFAKVERKHDTAMRSRLRASWRPGTETARRDMERSEKAEEEMFEALAEIRRSVLGK
jgi:hypothetical protein